MEYQSTATQRRVPALAPYGGQAATRLVILQRRYECRIVGEGLAEERCHNRIGTAHIVVIPRGVPR